MSLNVVDTKLARAGRQIETVLSDRPAVLHLITDFQIGGTERQAVELLKRLSIDRYNVRLAAVRKEGPLYSEIAERFPEIPEFPLTSFYDSNAVRQLMRLRSLMLREKVRVLHAHDFYAGVIGATAARLAGPKVKVIVCQRHLRLSDRRAHLWGTRYINRLADRVLVNSEAIRDYIIADGISRPEKIVLIRNGLRPINEDRSRPFDSLHDELGLSRETRIIGMVANLLPVKGHRYFIEAASLVSKAESDVHFVLVGEGSLRPEIEEQARDLGIADRLHLLGHRSDAASIVASFHISVLSSLHEGLPNAVLEAMACGVPVVATAVGGTTELISDGETGYLVPPANAAELSRRILFALKNAEKTARVASNGQKKTTARFGMEQMVESVEKLYDELLNVSSRVYA